ncbi:hypothetical protein Glove_428g95 [Diversispora epigaea]|uniref:Uncharacterized protein n=1 Tax=Diversispora epigaea TaxID=1348612 RepID=A0A397GXG5_9GLOM|nr:hypothetical protein Glove_428g95 [Diversispora epigaea]
MSDLCVFASSIYMFPKLILDFEIFRLFEIYAESILYIEVKKISNYFDFESSSNEEISEHITSKPSSFSGAAVKRGQSSGYKYQRRDNGDVFIIDMSNREHGLVALLLQDYFKVANGGVIINPIVVGIDEFHFSPSETNELIAADVTVYPNENHVQQPRVPYPGPPPGDKNSTKDWNDKCRLWMNQVYVRYVLGIKLHRKRDRKNGLGQYHRSMTARLWQQGVARYREWQFGTLIRKKQTPTTCNAPNLPEYQVNIPIAQVFWDPVLPLPPADGYIPNVPNPLAIETAPVNFIIDLYQVQQLVLSQQNNA